MTDGLRDSLGVALPLVQAPIGSATCPQLAAAVSEAGALGTLALSWRDLDEVRKAVRETRARTTRPFAVNFVLEWPQLERARAALEEGAAVLSTFWGDPGPCVRLAGEAGVPTIHSVGSVDEARAALDVGVEVLVAQGVEAGGHVRGTLPLTELLDGVLGVSGAVPVLAAGGIATAGDVRAALDRGAAGVWVGTRFLCSTEAAVDAAYQDAILAAGPNDTVLTTLFNKGWAGAPHRVLRNSTVTGWERAGMPLPGHRPGEDDVVARGPSGDPIERYADVIPVRGTTGDLESLALYAGMGAGRVSRIGPARAIVADLMGA